MTIIRFEEKPKEKFKIKIINETIIDDVTVNEAKQIADMLENRNAISSFLGKMSFTYSEIEKVN